MAGGRWPGPGAGAGGRGPGAGSDGRHRIRRGRALPGADRARRFRIAGGEAAEYHARLDLLEIRGELRGPALSQLRALLDRTRAMLWRLGRN